eukprot:Gb_12189 [translate_table: standard]
MARFNFRDRFSYFLLPYKFNTEDLARLIGWKHGTPISSRLHLKKIWPNMVRCNNCWR